MKTKLKKANMRSILFNSYMGAMLFILVGATILFAFIQFFSINSNIISNIQQTSKSVGESVDNQIKQMDHISMNALYSNLL
ncbi:MAG: hypothetical protein WCP73_00375, partial [Eubacteriales bacterium]